MSPFCDTDPMLDAKLDAWLAQNPADEDWWHIHSWNEESDTDA